MPPTTALTERTTRARRLAAPIREFVATQTSGAVILLIVTIVALAWANSPWSASYERLWRTNLALQLGSKELALDLRHWINDGLMASFLFVVGLEIRREFDMGELRERRRVATPVQAAVGGSSSRRSSTWPSTQANPRHGAGASPWERTPPSRSASLPWSAGGPRRGCARSCSPW